MHFRLKTAQGTLYPDVIESCPPPGAAKAKGKSHTIKSHHNVGGLPEDLQFSLIEPLRELFKVRKLFVLQHHNRQGQLSLQTMLFASNQVVQIYAVPAWRSIKACPRTFNSPLSSPCARRSRCTFSAFNLSSAARAKGNLGS